MYLFRETTGHKQHKLVQVRAQEIVFQGSLKGNFAGPVA